MYSEAQRKGTRQADLELSLKNLNILCEDVEKRKTTLANQVRKKKDKIVKKCDCFQNDLFHFISLLLFGFQGGN